MTRGCTVIVSLLLLSAILLHAQTPHHKSTSPQPQFSLSSVGDTRSLIQQMVDAVSRDNLVNIIRGLQFFGTRYELSPQQEAAADWMIKELDWWGIEAESDWYKFGIIWFTDIDLINEDTACAVALKGWILGTTDGGATWGHRKIQVSSGTFDNDLYGIDFSTPRIGWAVGTGGIILQTNDAGANWFLRQATTSRNLYDVRFADERVGFIVGSGGTVFRTTDGGTTWSAFQTGTTNALREVEVLDSMNIWAVGDVGAIVHSADGGSTWSLQWSGVGATLYGVDFVNHRLGWAVGYGPMALKTTNGGAAWTSLSQEVLPDRTFKGWAYNGVCFVDSMSGWITTNDGCLLKTTDGGRSWAKINILKRYGWLADLQKIKVSNARYLFACGGRTTIVASTDSGATWLNQAPGLPTWFFHDTRNIVVTIPGSVTPEKECLMVAHYDGVSTGPGADDNASGTAAVMEVARILKDYQFESTIRLLAVSAEEWGMLGSEEYASRARSQNRNIIGVVNGDMIGYPIVRDTTRLVIGSYLRRNWLIDSALVYNQRYRIGATLNPFTDSTGASDYGPFAMAGYDAMDVAEGTPREIWDGGNPHYHKASDSLVYLHPGLMRRATQLMLATVAEFAVPIGKVTTPFALPSSVVLEQNFPNPFSATGGSAFGGNPGTTLRFKLPQPSYVTLKVYDILGEEVATVLSGNLDAGVHGVTWKPKGQSSGVYICRLQGNGFLQTKKLVLLR